MAGIRGGLGYLACAGRVTNACFTLLPVRIDVLFANSRFPVISGFRVTWDSRRNPGKRVLTIAVERQKRIDEHKSGDSTPNLRLEFEEVKRERGGKKYAIVTREYMAEGHDGYECLANQKMIIDDEQGQMMSTIVRKYLLGMLHATFPLQRNKESHRFKIYQQDVPSLRRSVDALATARQLKQNSASREEAK